MDRILKALKLGGTGLLVIVAIWIYVRYQTMDSKIQSQAQELAEYHAKEYPTRAEADTVIIFADSALIRQKNELICKLQREILKYARTSAETVQVQTSIIDTILQSLDTAPCAKTIRGEYLYRDNGVAAYIAATAFCATDKMNFEVGGYALPAKPRFLRFDNITISVGTDGKKYSISASACFAVRDKFLIGPAVVDNKIGIAVGLRF